MEKQKQKVLIKELVAKDQKLDAIYGNLRKKRYSKMSEHQLMNEYDERSKDLQYIS